jgi:transcriptional regulator
MYTTSHFDETRPELLRGLIAQHPLGAVVINAGGALMADHIPFELGAATAQAPCGVLRAHVARANPLWRHDADALVIFQGPSGYVSPSLYEEKPVSGKVVPTWNYAVVHAQGRLRAIEDPAWILALLTRLTDAHEGSRALPWSVEDAPRAWLDGLLQAIVGIEIDVRQLQGKWKLSQNRSRTDQLAIAADTALPLYSRL